MTGDRVYYLVGLSLSVDLLCPTFPFPILATENFVTVVLLSKVATTVCSMLDKNRLCAMTCLEKTTKRATGVQLWGVQRQHTLQKSHFSEQLT